MFTDDLIETPLLENSWKTISFLNINPVHTLIMSFWFLRKQLIDTNDMQIQNVPCMTYCLKPFFHNVIMCHTAFCQIFSSNSLNRRL